MSITGEKWSSVLYKAVYSNKVEAVKALLLAGADPNAVYKSGGSPLFLAADSKSFGRRGNNDKKAKIIDLLIGASANVNFRNSNGLSPLIMAVRSKNTHAIQSLVAAGANREAKDNTGRTAWNWASVTRNASAMAALRSGKEQELYRESRIESRTLGSCRDSSA